MNQTFYSSKLKALLPLENYLLILNEKSRLNKYIHSQNTIQIKQLDLEQNTRRKSCHCSQCGQQSQFQFKTMNIPLKRSELLKELEYSQPQLIVTKSDSQMKIFYKKSPFQNLSISIPKDNTNNTRLSINIHGFQRVYNKQNTLLKMITDGQERSKRKESSGLFSQSNRNSINSSNSINTGTQSSLQNQKNSIQLMTPVSVFSPKRKNHNNHKKQQLLTHIDYYKSYNPYIISQNKYGLIKPFKLQSSISNFSNLLPKLNKKVT